MDEILTFSELCDRRRESEFTGTIVPVYEDSVFMVPLRN